MLSQVRPNPGVRDRRAGVGCTLSAPRWNPPGRNPAGWCSVNGAMAPVDHTPTAKAINFQVAFPPAWNGRAVQLGGGGMNGTIPG